MNQAELARDLGVSRAYVSMILSGKKKPSKRVAEKLRLVNTEGYAEANLADPKSCSSASSDTSPSSKSTRLLVTNGDVNQNVNQRNG